MPPYEYAPINSDDKFRLLELGPGNGDDILSGTLRIVSLFDAPEYQALSYTWGELVFPALIECSGNGYIAITSNLAAALRRLRYPNRKRTMWIDAICVDQRNTIERNHQVRHMRKIYEQAKEVLIWLGENTDNARLALGGLDELLEAVINAHLILFSPSLDSLLTTYHTSDQGVAFANLLKHSWFRRIWVIQGVTCARGATMLCGEVSMDWFRFLRIADRMHDEKLDLYFDARMKETFYHLSALHRQRDCWASNNTQSLPELLFHYRHCDSSDSRDKIFALAGLANGKVIPADAPDYSKHVTDVFQALASNALTDYAYLDILTCCSLPDADREHLPLPSWVPDWSRPLHMNSSPILAPNAYNASKGIRCRVALGQDKRKMIVRGILLGKVQSVCQPWSYATGLEGISQVKKIMELLEECRILFKGSKICGAQNRLRFLRTLVADLDNAGYRTKNRDFTTQYDTYHEYMEGRCSEQPLSFNSVGQRTTAKLITSYPKMRKFETALHYAAYGRAYCRFDDSRVGWVPEKAEVGDQVVVILGAQVPILLRPRGSSYIVVGETYVDRMMDGEALEGPNSHIQDIKLV
ncbi:hypothetical protein MMC28_001597 [Mycoblastus sanguinarius]|nr:hypothetical protein [Mycoblastus sanguinarius]